MPNRCVFLLVAAIVIAAAAAAAAQAPAPLRIIALEGEGAINNIGERTAKAPVVRVEDDDGRPMSGVSVTFVLPDMGPGGYFPSGGTTLTTTTDAQGIASAGSLRPNNIAGRFTIRVTAARGGQTATTEITQINAAPAVTSRRSRKKFLIFGLAAGAAAGAILAFTGGGDASSVTPAGGAVVTPGSPVFGPPR